LIGLSQAGTRSSITWRKSLISWRKKLEKGKSLF